MIFYNWTKIFEIAQRDALECYRIFKMMTNKEIPESKFDPIYMYSKIDFSGQSFLLHPDVLLYNSYLHTYRDISIYIAIASLRSWSEYVVNDTITVDLLDSPIDPRQVTNNTRLLRVKDEKIHFLYEMSPQKKELH